MYLVKKIYHVTDDVKRALIKGPYDMMQIMEMVL